MVNTLTYIEPGTLIRVWDVIHDDWHNNYYYIGDNGDGLLHLVECDGIRYLIPTEDIWELC